MEDEYRHYEEEILEIMYFRPDGEVVGFGRTHLFRNAQCYRTDWTVAYTDGDQELIFDYASDEPTTAFNEFIHACTKQLSRNSVSASIRYM